MLDNQKRVKRVKDYLEELHAMLMLEYHNKNHLHFAANPKRLNEDERELVSLALDELDQIEVLP